MSSERQELIRRFAVAIVQGEHANTESDFSIAGIWHIATELADAEPLQPALVTAQEPEHTREDWAEVQGDVTRLTKDVERLSGTVESLEARIQRAVALLRGAIRYHTAAGFVVTEDTVDEAVQILEGNSDD